MTSSKLKHSRLLLVMVLASAWTGCFSDHQRPSVSAGRAAPVAVIGGAPAGTQDFPYIVNIWLNSPEDSFVDHLCGGTLIGKRWVLTAAHCVLEDVTDKSRGSVKLSQISVFLGSLKRSGESGRKLTARSIRVHPQFKWPVFDVALIELNESVEDVQPVQLNQVSLQDFSTQPLAAAAGWGLTDENGKVDAEVLRKIDLPLISRESCGQDPDVRQKGWSIGPETICARTSLGLRATCAGDSGGPLIQKRNGQDVQIGVISWGTACRLAFRDRQSDVEGYSDVSAAYPWIQSQLLQ